ncbi:MAG: OsmC family protein [Vicinamibacterales bacterium]
MLTDDHIGAAIARNVTALNRRDSLGRGTAVTTARAGANLTCRVTEGPWTIDVGMTEKYGGDGSAPNPGVFGRAALASCLAISYAMWGSRLGVPLADVTVEVQADYDVRGELGASDAIRPGYGQIRAIVTVASDAPEDDVRRVVETADKYGSWLDNISNPVDVRRELRVAAPVRS